MINWTDWRDDHLHYSPDELRTSCCGTKQREDELCGFCWNEAVYIVWWRYEMNKQDPIYNYGPSQKQIGRFIRKICDLD